MRVLNIIWMFAAGTLLAIAFAVFRAPPETPVGAGSESVPEPRADPGFAGAARAGGAELGSAAVAESGAAEGTEAAARRGSGAAGAGRGDAAAEASTEAELPAAADPRPAAAEASAVREELLGMAAGYRNRVFLHAIRERGYFCEGVLDTQLGRGDVEAWRVACGGEAFLISVDAAGELVVDPLFFVDGVGPSVPRVEDSPLQRQQFRVAPPESD